MRLVAALPLLMTVPTSEPVTWPELPATLPWAVTVADWNGDGGDDVLINNHRDGQHATPPLPDWHDQLWVSDGGTWRLELELPYADRHGCAALHADDDGRLDLFCAVGSSQLVSNDGLGPNELWLNTVDGWVESAAAWGIDDPTARGRDVAALDWNHDGRTDLFVGAAPRADALRSQPAVWLNRGDHFEHNRVLRYGTACAYAWLGGVVTCDAGAGVLFETGVFWLGLSVPSFRIGTFYDATVDDGILILNGTQHIVIDGVRVNLPRSARVTAVNDDTIFVTAALCSPTPTPLTSDPAEMILRHNGLKWVVSEAPATPGVCATQATWLDDQLVVWERRLDGTPLPSRLVEGL